MNPLPAQAHVSAGLMQAKKPFQTTRSRQPPCKKSEQPSSATEEEEEEEEGGVLISNMRTDSPGI
ncbi:hypothetical protein P167DRAFT_577692 [Morchella conica CCBAS932]|uniref:Uncharacterized protein n=1 Tax=Morchella conica CCBAS932 TaxID=1392247 RepID=A0A3N4KEV0_9PEZI|nr:hypothetical protein P167DRAFT_577692 [Morchella conica CCBAS932]